MQKPLLREKTETEEWRPYREQPAYEVSNLGNVRRNGGKPLKPEVTRLGYLRVTLSGGRRVLVHRMVAAEFVDGFTTERREINHKDGVKGNCRADNLEWATRHHNLCEAFRLGLMKPRRGPANHKTKLTADQVRQIRALANDYTDAELAERFGVSRATVYDILIGKSWRYLIDSE